MNNAEGYYRMETMKTIETMTTHELEEQRDRLDNRKYRIERGAFAGRLDATEHAEIAEIEAKIAELDAKIQAEFEVVWPRDLHGRLGSIRAERERERGWTMDDLKKTAKHHKIQ